MQVCVRREVSIVRVSAGTRGRARSGSVVRLLATLGLAIGLSGCDTSAAGAPNAKPPSRTGGSEAATAGEVLLIGDSYVEVPNRELNRELSRLARGAGLIGEHESYRDNAISGTRLAGGSNPIPAQYTTARERAPAKVLIMDGGGNDIIAAECASCPALEDAIAAATALFQQVRSDGTVEQIIFFFYPELPNFPALRTDAANFMRSRLQSVCESSTVPCHFLDLRPVFQGHPELISADNLHPTVAGSHAMARAIFEILRAKPVTR